MVVGGKLGEKNFTDSVEIFDLSSNEAVSPEFPKFPFKTAFAKGISNRNNTPMVCSGFPSVTKSCQIFEQGRWKSGPAMKVPRWNFGIAKISINSSAEFLVTGGLHVDLQSSSLGLNSAEVLTKTGWELNQRQLPICVYGHCMLSVNSTSVMLIGGVQGSIPSSQTYLFTGLDQGWVPGPRLKQERAYHTCSKIGSRWFSSKTFHLSEGSPYN